MNATAIATDKDAGAFGTITYEIDPTDAIAISLVSVDNNGEIQLISSPDGVKESTLIIADVPFASPDIDCTRNTTHIT
jgi:hypothetical protein